MEAKIKQNKKNTGSYNQTPTPRNQEFCFVRGQSRETIGEPCRIQQPKGASSPPRESRGCFGGGFNFQNRYVSSGSLCKRLMAYGCWQAVAPKQKARGSYSKTGFEKITPRQLLDTDTAAACCHPVSHTQINPGRTPGESASNLRSKANMA